MAGDSEVNNPPTVVPGQELSMPEIQKVQHKLKVKPKVRKTKTIPKAKESKEISKVKIPKETPQGCVFLNVKNVGRSLINMT